jgi:hypothetical protein
LGDYFLFDEGAFAPSQTLPLVFLFYKPKDIILFIQGQD